MFQPKNAMCNWCGMGIILIGTIGYGSDIRLCKAETVLVPWKGYSWFPAQAKL
ncbi:hypothetical protein [Pseudophaeobacter sp.]|uniref:hypothetical protein n=1 Tax=Pseudophaeobacter sp. TaxID=1971739 RepID=UPI0032983E0D